MNYRDYLSAYIAIGVFLFGAASAVIRDAEEWPFSNYSMYAKIMTPTFYYSQLFGVVRGPNGIQEIPLNSTSYLYPFDDRAAVASVTRMLRVSGRPAAETGLKDLLALYERRRGFHHGPNLVGIRAYEASWDLRDARDGDLPKKGELLVEYVMP